MRSTANPSFRQSTLSDRTASPTTGPRKLPTHRGGQSSFLTAVSRDWDTGAVLSFRSCPYALHEREQCPEAFLDGLRVSGAHRSMVIRASEGTQQSRNINNSKYLHGLCEQMGGQVGAKSDLGPPSLVGAHCAEHHSPPYLGLGQSCPSFLPGAWSPADSCNPRGLPVWPAPDWTPAAEALLPASFPGGPGKVSPLRPLLSVHELFRETFDHLRGQIYFLLTSPLLLGTNGRQSWSWAPPASALGPRATPGNSCWQGQPGNWQPRAGTLPAREEVAVSWAKREADHSCRSRVIHSSSEKSLLHIRCVAGSGPRGPSGV